MCDVILVTKEKLERVLSERQHDLCLGLPRAEMQVIEIIWNGPFQRRQRGVHHEVMVAGIGFFHTGRRYPHVDETKADGRGARYVGAVGRIDEIDFGVRRGGMPTGCSGHRAGSRIHNPDPDTLRHQRRRVRNVSLIPQEKLEGVLSGGQVDLSLGLSGAEMQVIEIVWNWLIQWRKLGIDQQMVVPGILPVGARRRHAHPAQSEMNRGPGWKRRAIVEVDEIDRSPCGRRRRSAGDSGLTVNRPGRRNIYRKRKRG